MTTTAAALLTAHAALRVPDAGTLPEERAIFAALKDGRCYIKTLDELGTYFGVQPQTFRHWRRHDTDGVLDGCAQGYNVRAAERLRQRMMAQCQRVRLRDADLFETLRRQSGF